ncbi:hypothetical protein JOB18_026661 [Solea senegalensis]|uniref:Uncharacterized protein n=1 Tax=Solea senegalensis TaxID=28829 RepID=A0AAV6PT51_SOLSE|nr:hypothetical protein JOB18_026661 [Solea senegalensis]
MSGQCIRVYPCASLFAFHSARFREKNKRRRKQPPPQSLYYPVDERITTHEQHNLSNHRGSTVKLWVLQYQPMDESGAPPRSVMRQSGRR